MPARIFPFLVGLGQNWADNPGTRTRRRMGIRLSELALILAVLPIAWAGRGPEPRVSWPRPGEQAPVEPIPAVREVRLLVVDGVISPLAARYLARELEAAAADRVALVLIRLNTPGGLESSMRDMTEAILASPVPVAVHVAPSGARAASAGMFLTLAAHVAAMAPGTSIGAAHPVALGGDALDPELAEKLVSDAAALARALAETRDRNAEWAEAAVRQSVAVTAAEALELDVIDLIADDEDALLDAVHGREVVTTAGPVTIETAAARRTARLMTVPERIIQALTDPNIAYILFTLGIIGIIAELYNPGVIFPGATGVIALILAFVAFGSLPISWAGIVLLLLGIGLFVADLYTEGMGLLAVGGLIAFVLGSLMLYTPVSPVSPAMPAVRVSPWLVVLMAAGIAAFFVVVIRSLLQLRGRPPVSGPAALIGRTGVAASAIAPYGSVRIDTENWSARTAGDEIAAGEPVDVVAVEGVTLVVQRRIREPGSDRHAAD